MSADDFFRSLCPRCGYRIEVITEAQKTALRMLCIDIDRQREFPPGSGHHIGYKKVKQMLVYAWERAHDREAEMLPAFDDEGWDCVFRRDSRLTKEEASELLAFGEAWAVEKAIVRSKSGRERRLDPF